MAAAESSMPCVEAEDLVDVSIQWWEAMFKRRIREAAEKGEFEAYFKIRCSYGWRRIVNTLIKIAKENELMFFRSETTELASGLRRMRWFSGSALRSLEESSDFRELKRESRDETIEIGVAWGSK